MSDKNQCGSIHKFDEDEDFGPKRKKQGKNQARRRLPKRYEPKKRFKK